VTAVVLAVAGITKVFRPDPAARMLKALGLRVPGWLVRGVAVVEVGLAGAALITGSRIPAAAISASYAAVAAIVALALSRPTEALASCGCFGELDSPPTVAHLLLNLAGSIIALAALVWPVGDLATVARRQPLHGAVLATYVLLATWFWYLVVSGLGRAAGISARGRAGGQS
jgi:hypothetical protein